MAHISYELEIISALPDPLMSWARLQRSHLPALLNPRYWDAVSVQYYNAYGYCFSIYQ